jgi:hypothetical protein
VEVLENRPGNVGRYGVVALKGRDLGVADKAEIPRGERRHRKKFRCSVGSGGIKKNRGHWSLGKMLFLFIGGWLLDKDEVVELIRLVGVFGDSREVREELGKRSEDVEELRLEIWWKSTVIVREIFSNRSEEGNVAFRIVDTCFNLSGKVTQIVIHSRECSESAEFVIKENMRGYAECE